MIPHPFGYRIVGYRLDVWQGRMLRPLEALWARLNALRNLPNVIVVDIVCESKSISILRNHYVKVG